MEQNDTNKEVVAVPVRKEVPFWNRPSTRFSILVGIILVGVWYYTTWVPRQECAKTVTYHPAGSGMGIFGTEKSTEGYYTYTGSKGAEFKTQGEAITHCSKNI